MGIFGRGFGRGFAKGVARGISEKVQEDRAKRDAKVTRQQAFAEQMQLAAINRATEHDNRARENLNRFIEEFGGDASKGLAAYLAVGGTVDATDRYLEAYDATRFESDLEYSIEDKFKFDNIRLDDYAEVTPEQAFSAIRMEVPEVQPISIKDEGFLSKIGLGVDTLGTGIAEEVNAMFRPQTREEIPGLRGATFDPSGLKAQAEFAATMAAAGVDRGSSLEALKSAYGTYSDQLDKDLNAGYTGPGGTFSMMVPGTDDPLSGLAAENEYRPRFRNMQTNYLVRNIFNSDGTFVSNNARLAVEQLNINPELLAQVSTSLAESYQARLERAEQFGGGTTGEGGDGNGGVREIVTQEELLQQQRTDEERLKQIEEVKTNFDDYFSSLFEQELAATEGLNIAHLIGTMTEAGIPGDKQRLALARAAAYNLSIGKTSENMGVNLESYIADAPEETILPSINAAAIESLKADADAKGIALNPDGTAPNFNEITSPQSQRRWTRLYGASHNLDGSIKESLPVEELVQQIRDRGLDINDDGTVESRPSAQAGASWDRKYRATHTKDGKPRGVVTSVSSIEPETLYELLSSDQFRTPVMSDIVPDISENLEESIPELLAKGIESQYAYIRQLIAKSREQGTTISRDALVQHLVSVGGMEQEDAEAAASNEIPVQPV